MQGSILREHGLFWWCDETIGPGEYFPKNHVPGVLEIDDGGKAFLNLEGALSRGDDIMRVFLSKLNSEQRLLPIQGILKESARYVLLPAPYQNGGKASHMGLSHENFASSTCLVSPEIISAKPEKVYGFETLLDNLDDWIGRNSIRLAKTKTSFKASYRAPLKSKYKLTDFTIEIGHDLEAPFAPSIAREINLREHTRITVRTRRGNDYAWLEESHRSLADLLTLLTGTQVYLAWPRIKLRGKKDCTYYYSRASGVTKKLSRHEHTLPLSIISADFGKIYESWHYKRQLYGPGLYLFLSVMREQKTYIENKFVNLIWGLESLHRKTATANVNDKIQKKVSDIIEAVPRKHKRWLSSRLENAAEPSLKERLLNLFNDLPIVFDAKELDSFCAQCAGRRNDISHFGGIREDRDYDEFVSELNRLTNALFYLYYGVILQKIGIEANLIANWLFDGFKSVEIKRCFFAAGLTRYQSI